MTKLVNRREQVLPPYYKVEAEKQNTRIPNWKERYTTSDSNIQAPLQDVLNHTASRILLIPDVAAAVDELTEKYGPLDIEFIYKYGMDGSKGHPIHKQLCDCCREKGCLFSTHMVALQLVTKINGKMYILYDNSLKNSPLGCRPLRYWFVAEKKRHVKAEIKRLEDEITVLQPLNWSENVTVNFKGTLYSFKF